MKQSKKIVVLMLAVLLFITGSLSTTFTTVKAAPNKTMFVTAKTLNVRSGPSTKSKVITTVKKNAKVIVITSKGSWNKIKANKKAGWVPKKYLTTKKTDTKKEPAQQTKPSKGIYVTTKALNVKSGPNAKSKVLTKVKKGKQVVFITKKGSWSKIKVNKKAGWVQSKYLNVKKEPVKQVKSAYITTKTLNVKSGPSTKSKVITKVKKDKQVILITTKGSWSKVKVGKKAGWVPSKHLRKNKL